MVALLRRLVSFVIYFRYERNIKNNSSLYDNLITDKTIEYGEEERISFDYDQYIIEGNINKEDFRSHLKKTQTHGRASFTVLDNCFLLGVYATAVWNNKIVLDSCLSSKGYLLQDADRRKIVYRNFYKIDKEFEWGISLVNCLSHSFFHWVVETLPLLESLFYFENKKLLDKNIPIFVPVNGGEFIIDYLLLMGISNDRIIQWRYNKVMVKKLIMPSVRFFKLELEDPYWPRMMYPKSIFDFLRNQFAAYRIKNEKLPKKIYISRGDVGARGIQNETELMVFLESKGYKTLLLSDYKVEEQIAIFTNASHLVTPHGAGLTNILYSDKLNIVELFPENRSLWYANYFYQISAYFGHVHRVLMCKSDDNQNTVVDLGEIDKILS